MLNPHMPQRIVALLSVLALGFLATGCSSAATQATFSGIRGLASTSRPAAYINSFPRLAAQRHAREHALSSTPTIKTQHHQPTRTL